MSQEQLQAIIERVKGDTSLQEKLKAAANSDAVVSIAKESGLSVSADGLKNASKISEEELEGAAGGIGPATHLTNGCGCPPGAITHLTMDTNPRCGCLPG
jgi:predicted ribosomally synthesized peptide with nif11-like leader